MPSGHIDPAAPLRPLSNHAMSWLRALATGRKPAYLINPGVRDRFRREGLTVEVFINGAEFVEITDAGRAKLEGA